MAIPKSIFYSKYLKKFNKYLEKRNCEKIVLCYISFLFQIKYFKVLSKNIFLSIKLNDIVLLHSTIEVLGNFYLYGGDYDNAFFCYKNLVNLV